MAKKRAFARYTKKGQLVPGSLVVTTKGGYPDKTSLWGEVPVDLFQEDNKFLPWKMVIGGAANDGVVLNDEKDPNRFTIIGPNNDTANGWVYLKIQFSQGIEFNIDYDWTSFDEGTGVDKPVFWTSSVEPTGIPGDLTPKVSTTPESGTWGIGVNPGDWFAIGVYSTDSCCGRGFLQLDFNL